MSRDALMTIQTWKAETDMIHEGIEFEKHVDLDADIVVVGSGAGGPVVAKELQEKGHSVILLEEGGHHKTKDFGKDIFDSFKTLYRDYGSTAALGIPPVPFPLGRCLGGTTAVNSGTCFRMPDSVLRKWEITWNIPDIEPEKMRPYFERVEDIYSVNEVHSGNMGKNGETFLKGAKKLGYSCGPLKRNMDENCTGCGVCTLGCPTDGKRHTLLNYIPMASEMGCEVYSDFRVEKIVKKGNQVSGVSGSVLHRESSKRKTTFSVKAKIVVIAAGAIGTPLLLQKNKLANSSGQVGRNLRLHPGIRVSALMDEEIKGWLGVPQGTYVDEFWNEGIMMEGIFVGPLLSAPSLPLFGKKSKDIMFNYPKIASFGAMILDETRGRVRPGPFGRPLITYWLIKEDLKKCLEAIAYASAIYFAAGAKKVFPNLPGLYEINSKSQITDILTSSFQVGDLEMMAFHPMGTARMGTDPKKSVTDPYGETFDVKNLFVADASLFPSCLGVNPMESIMAFANRNADYISAQKL
jgi:choline dehydrogenase-like flavoprotein